MKKTSKPSKTFFSFTKMHNNIFGVFFVGKDYNKYLFQEAKNLYDFFCKLNKLEDDKKSPSNLDPDRTNIALRLLKEFQENIVKTLKYRPTGIETKTAKKIVSALEEIDIFCKNFIKKECKPAHIMHPQIYQNYTEFNEAFIEYWEDPKK